MLAVVRFLRSMAVEIAFLFDDMNGRRKQDCDGIGLKALSKISELTWRGGDHLIMAMVQKEPITHCH